MTFAIPITKVFALTSAVDQSTDPANCEAMGYVNLNTSGFNWYGVLSNKNTSYDVKGYWLLVAA